MIEQQQAERTAAEQRERR